ncbi:hypothetical protein FEM48_Zijuj12G0109300 [Ziziphus jujuba var. spinosa]|uniref:Casein kinase substrate phosphoprotein PP28 domain-containing protein n=1 Tax=Ziziphus jujuba var. spinosa TaxID=714518 RepID=A0A978UCX0_ZIZJJ|nr:hypothetical protein FEM48_Zijuj12G0109300 [Ziziphus jujuba var. spinosa]
MGRGKFKGKPTGHRNFSTPEELRAGTSARPRSFKRKRKGTQGLIEIENPNVAKSKNVKAKNADIEKTSELSRREREEIEKQKAHERYMRLQEQGKTEQAKKDLGNYNESSFVDLRSCTLGEEWVAWGMVLDDVRSFYNRVCLERLAMIRQQRAEAAKKREEEKAGCGTRNARVGGGMCVAHHLVGD